ncbi:hypothetical protein SDC9_201321 [bioreactor metagenome]|uniref:Uncharacterized protein n=1 Tax=bioreactor metagenome TaxID=1076179 RepID=A0A645IR12_9ZZZZ
MTKCQPFGNRHAPAPESGNEADAAIVQLVTDHVGLHLQPEHRIDVFDQCAVVAGLPDAVETHAVPVGEAYGALPELTLTGHLLVDRGRNALTAARDKGSDAMQEA